MKLEPRTNRHKGVTEVGSAGTKVIQRHCLSRLKLCFPPLCILPDLQCNRPNCFKSFRQLFHSIWGPNFLPLHPACTKRVWLSTKSELKSELLEPTNIEVRTSNRNDARKEVCSRMANIPTYKQGWHLPPVIRNTVFKPVPATEGHVS